MKLSADIGLKVGPESAMLALGARFFTLVYRIFFPSSGKRSI